MAFAWGRDVEKCRVFDVILRNLPAKFGLCGFCCTSKSVQYLKHERILWIRVRFTDSHDFVGVMTSVVWGIHPTATTNRSATSFRA